MFAGRPWSGAVGRERGVPAQGRVVLRRDRQADWLLPGRGGRARRAEEGDEHQSDGGPSHQLLGGRGPSHTPASGSRTAPPDAGLLLPLFFRLSGALSAGLFFAQSWTDRSTL